MQHLHQAEVLLAHPLDQRVFERLGVHCLEQASERAFTGHVTLSARSGPRAAAQISALSVIETLDKFGDGMRVFAASAHGQSDQRQDRRQLMAFALGLAGIGHSVPESLPERRQLLGGHRAGGWQGPLMFRQGSGKLGRAQLLQRRGMERAHPNLLRVLVIGVEILPIPLRTLRRPQPFPSGGLVTSAPELLRVHERLDRQNRMSKMLLPIPSQSITSQLQNSRGQIGPAARRGQYEEALVLRDQMAPLGHLAGRPMQPAIARLEMKGRRTEHQQRQPLLLIFGHVAERLPHDRGVFKIMFPAQQFIEPDAFGLLDQTHRDVAEQPGFLGQPRDHRVRKMN